MLFGLVSRKWFWRITIFSVLATIGGPLIYAIWTRYAGSSELATYIAHLDATDPGWDLDGICKTRNERIRGMKQNGWLKVQEVINKLPKGWDKSTLEISDDLNELDNNQLPYFKTQEHLRELIENNRDTLKIAREMVKFPEGGREFEVPDNPLTMSLHVIQEARGAMALLSYAGQEASYGGRPTEAFQDAHAVLNVSRSISDEPMMITQLVRMAGRSVSCGIVKKLLATNQVEAGLAELQAEYLKEADSKTLYYAFRGERACIHKIFGLMESGDMNAAAAGMGGMGPGGPGFWQRLGLRGLKTYLPANHKTCLEKLTELTKVSELPVDEQWTAIKKYSEPRYTGLSQVFVRLLLPATQKVGEAGIRSAGELRATAVGIACERYRLKHGKWPEKLDDIPKDILASVPNDPFTGKPINYKTLPDGVVVYTVGPDEKDNGGAVSQTKGTVVSDYGIKLFNPELRRANPPEPKVSDLPEELIEPGQPEPEKP